MNLILTTDEVKFVRRGVADYKKSVIIDTREILSELGYEGPVDEVPVTHHFIINDEIRKKLESAINSKRIDQVVYFHHSIDRDLIDNIKCYLEGSGVDDLNLILFDREESLVPLWTHFDEIKK